MELLKLIRSPISPEYYLLICQKITAYVRSVGRVFYRLVLH